MTVFQKRMTCVHYALKNALNSSTLRLKTNKKKRDLSDVIDEHLFLRVRGGHAVTK